jgi:hypothetical protein
MLYSLYWFSAATWPKSTIALLSFNQQGDMPSILKLWKSPSQPKAPRLHILSFDVVIIVMIFQIQLMHQQSLIWDGCRIRQSFTTIKLYLYNLVNPMSPLLLLYRFCFRFVLFLSLLVPIQWYMENQKRSNTFVHRHLSTVCTYYKL